MLVYFLRGSLPWQGLKEESVSARNDKILTVKATTSLATLCMGCPQELQMYFEYVFKLGFEQKPDYSYLRRLFVDLLESLGYRNDRMFDWMVKDMEMVGAALLIARNACGILEHFRHCAIESYPRSSCQADWRPPARPPQQSPAGGSANTGSASVIAPYATCTPAWTAAAQIGTGTAQQLHFSHQDLGGAAAPVWRGRLVDLWLV